MSELSMKNEIKLSDLVAGDSVILCSGYGRNRAVVKIDRVTPTKIIVGKSRFRRLTGRAEGAYHYGSANIRIPEEGEIEQIRVENKTRHLAYEFRHRDWDKVPLATLEAIAALL